MATVDGQGRTEGGAFGEKYLFLIFSLLNHDFFVEIPPKCSEIQIILESTAVKCQDFHHLWDVLSLK